MGLNPQGDQSALVSFCDAMKKADDCIKQFVAKHYEGAGEKTEQIMKRMLDSTGFYANAVVQVKTPNLYDDRFVLVGDERAALGRLSPSQGSKL